jgi:hypothetical protein
MEFYLQTKDARIGIRRSRHLKPQRRSRTYKLDLGLVAQVLSSCSKALVRVFAIRVYEKRVLESNLDSENL